MRFARQLAGRNNLPPCGVEVRVDTGAWIVVAAVVAALAFGTYRLLTDGRFGSSSRGDGELGVEPVVPAEATQASPASPAVEGVTAAGGQLGERATLVQFSSAFCTPCRATRLTLGEVAQMLEGIAHVEVDAEEHLEATRRLGILRTPTTLVLDARGREVSRASGAPKKDQVLAALSQIPDVP